MQRGEIAKGLPLGSIANIFGCRIRHGVGFVAYRLAHHAAQTLNANLSRVSSWLVRTSRRDGVPRHQKICQRHGYGRLLS